MARVRSNKSKNKSSKAEEIKAGQSDETLGQHHSLQPAVRSQERQEQQRIQEEPSADSREVEKPSDHTSSTINGHQGSVDVSAAHRRIAERAFILFQESGCEHGNDWAHWFEAERQIKSARV
ncbi:MAG: hypothetical protein CV081_01405 [Nitrospira sp. LK265]|nr:DUF2934 domain-containing protein [Nitrospira sp.]NGZ59144.1 hypothetical protein [Nitrospira sp. LK265]